MQSWHLVPGTDTVLVQGHEQSHVASAFVGDWTGNPSFTPVTPFQLLETESYFSAELNSRLSFFGSKAYYLVYHNPATQHAVAGVDHRRLTGGNSADVFGKFDVPGTVCGLRNPLYCNEWGAVARADL